MFKDLLLKSLQSLSPEEKDKVRKVLEDDKKVIDEEIGETGEKNIEEKGENVMPDKNDKKSVNTSISIDEKTKSNEVDKGSTETTKVDETKKVDETTKDTNQTPNGEDENKGGNDTVDTKTDGENTEDTAKEQVQETETAGNGVRIEDLVTKEELAERLSAMEAKCDAVLKENRDLKNKLSAMEDKYENKDFGNFQKQGMIEKDKQANSTFDEYAKQFS